MFGDQAVRLLRENWGGIIQPDVNGNLVEHGATALAQELYAMFNDDIPQTNDAPVTINQANPNGPPGLTVNNPLGGDGLTVNNGNTTFSGGNFSYNNPGGTFDVAGSTINLGANNINFGAPRTAATPSSPAGPGIGGGGGGTTISFPPLPNILFPPDTPAGAPRSLASLLDQAGGGTSSFLGQVLSGSGNSYRVALFGNGPGQPATATVTATVPQIDPSETIPPGTWIASVHAFAGGTVDNPTFAYAFQPPVWLG